MFNNANASSPASTGVHSIDHYALEVPSLELAETFHAAFGLDVTHEAGGLAVRTTGGAHVWARMLPGSRKRLAYLSFSAFADDIDVLRAQIKAVGGRETSSLPTAVGGGVSGAGFWFHDPDGNLIQVKAAARVSPSHRSSAAPSARRALRGVADHASVLSVRPQRLSHVLLFTPDIDRAIAFYRDGLGLRYSDGSAGIVAFLHGRHGSDHHMVAFVQSSAKGWHHAAWDVPSVDDVGLGKMQMQAAGYAQGWGVGRHVLGSNYFHYVRDPWGSFCEYSADIDYVPPGQAWPAGDHPPEDALYLWGPDVPPYFIVNTEAETG
ncbi:catechol 2,3-dioxygenase [Pandoraea eparura]|uniref:Catechol 2,3-dioxygenase n=1 Tax=Pandoraea eparura TaxID=2508291 RepID=A0A5E4RFM1_9BURK|nr:VOC family protein [Pandoraea eparura]VVD61611.1 catechol 2,3-dioxygenase [Pandoraea eparura]